MKLQGDIQVNGKSYAKGDELPWYQIYPFFMFHMLMFGGSGFVMAYIGDAPLLFLYLHGGLAILIYTVFYINLFGLDEVKWMFINAGLGLLGIYTQVGWLLSLFGRKIGDYPFYVHLIPFLYYVLYTFLLRQALLDLTRAREDESRKRFVENSYVAVSIALSLFSYWLEKR